MEKLSRYLCLILRHKPEVIGITLDEHGYANVDELIRGVQKNNEFNREMLEQIVEEDGKQRYSFNEDHTKIRCNQGHSIQVDVELEEKIPPSILYHGTATKYESSILENGLVSKSRLYVHLSGDMETASKVGKRHGELIIFEVDAKKMVKDGYVFYLSKNNVWLTKCVPTMYLTKLK